MRHALYHLFAAPTLTALVHASQVRDLSSFDISWVPVTNNRTEMVQLSKARLLQDDKYNALSRCVTTTTV